MAHGARQKELERDFVSNIPKFRRRRDVVQVQENRKLQEEHKLGTWCYLWI